MSNPDDTLKIQLAGAICDHLLQLSKGSDLRRRVVFLIHSSEEISHAEKKTIVEDMDKKIDSLVIAEMLRLIL